MVLTFFQTLFCVYWDDHVAFVFYLLIGCILLVDFHILNKYPLVMVYQRRQWHPTPVLLPGKSMDGGAWWAAVHGVSKSQTRLSDLTFTFHFHALEKEMATHSNVLAWRIPGMGEPGGLPSMGSHRVGHNWSNSAAAAAVMIYNTFYMLLNLV